MHSIEVYGLSRRDLINARRDRLISVLAHIRNVKDVIAEIEERGESDRLNTILERNLIEFKRLAADDSPYFVATRAVIRKNLDGQLS